MASSTRPCTTTTTITTAGAAAAAATTTTTATATRRCRNRLPQRDLSCSATATTITPIITSTVTLKRKQKKEWQQPQWPRKSHDHDQNPPENYQPRASRVSSQGPASSFPHPVNVNASNAATTTGSPFIETLVFASAAVGTSFLGLLYTTEWTRPGRKKLARKWQDEPGEKCEEVGAANPGKEAGKRGRWSVRRGLFWYTWSKKGSPLERPPSARPDTRHRHSSVPIGTKRTATVTQGTNTAPLSRARHALFSLSNTACSIPGNAQRQSPQRYPIDCSNIQELTIHTAPAPQFIQQPDRSLESVVLPSVAPGDHETDDNTMTSGTTVPPPAVRSGRLSSSQHALSQPYLQERRYPRRSTLPPSFTAATPTASLRASKRSYHATQACFSGNCENNGSRTTEVASTSSRATQTSDAAIKLAPLPEPDGRNLLARSVSSHTLTLRSSSSSFSSVSALTLSTSLNTGPAKGTILRPSSPSPSSTYSSAHSSHALDSPERSSPFVPTEPNVAILPRSPTQREVWDEDFIGSDLIVPDAIRACQATIRDDLRAIREFALVVEELASLYRKIQAASRKAGHARTPPTVTLLKHYAQDIERVRVLLSLSSPHPAESLAAPAPSTRDLSMSMSVILHDMLLGDTVSPQTRRAITAAAAAGATAAISTGGNKIPFTVDMVPLLLDGAKDLRRRMRVYLEELRRLL